MLIVDFVNTNFEVSSSQGETSSAITSELSSSQGNSSSATSSEVSNSTVSSSSTIHSSSIASNNENSHLPDPPYTYTVSNGKATITSYNVTTISSSSSFVTIPSNINGYSVSAI